MTAIDFNDVQNCPIRQVLRGVMGKWTTLILVVIGQDKKRFAQIQREIGDISHQVLSTTLRALEADGYLRREVVPNKQVEVYYELTPQGREFMKAFQPMLEWAVENFDRVQDARAEYEKKSA